jgi:acetyl-CoA C-acetyltransferase
MRKCVITGAVRTAVGAYCGGLKTVPSEVLAAEVLKEAIRRSDIPAGLVQQVILGEVVGSTPDVARAAALLAGLGESVPGYTIDRQCGSALQAVVSATQEIAAGDADVIIAGGTENMSRSPYYLPFSVRYEGFRLGDKPLLDAFNYASSYDYAPVNGQLPEKCNMGLTAENVAARYHITREAQDRFAYDSQMKAAKAQQAGRFKDEIIPVTVALKKEQYVFDTDEHMRPQTTLEGLAKLPPSFKPDGAVTPGNSSGMNDGASAVVVMSEEKAAELGRKPLCRVIANATCGVDPRLMGLGPARAIPMALAKAGLRLEDIGLFELNEAFAAQSLGCLIELGMEPGGELYTRVNVNGGAIAHGHALGNSGTRILTTLIYEMKRAGVRYGIASLCIGGGQGIAMIVENIK